MSVIPSVPTTTSGRLALVGSGEYLPVMQETENWLLGDNERIYVQLATAAAPEGSTSLERWHRLGREAARRLDATQVVVDVRNREDAHDPKNVAAIAGAGLVYLSGGNPTFLADTLRNTPVWDAIVAAWNGGAALVYGLPYAFWSPRRPLPVPSHQNGQLRSSTTQRPPAPPSQPPRSSTSPSICVWPTHL